MTIEQILEAIENMKVLELNELVKAAEEKFGVSASAPVMMAGAVAGDVHADRGRANHPVSCQRCAERLGRSRVFELGHHHAHYDFVGHRIDHSPATLVCAAIGGTVDWHAARQYRVRFGGWIEPVFRKHEGTP